MKDRIKLLTELFLTFAKIGCFTLGGGYAMLPLIAHEAADVKGWVTEEEMADYMTLAQSTPGVIGINSATAVGHRAGGFWGSVCATLGMVLPSFLIIVILAGAYAGLKDIPIVERAFAGVRACVVALILAAVIRLYRASVKGRFQISVAAAALVSSTLIGVPPQYIIAAGALIGLAYGVLRKRSGRGG